MNKRFGALALLVAAAAATAGLLASTSNSAVNTPYCKVPICLVSLTGAGPQPSNVRMYAAQALEFLNEDSAPHTVVFANGLCSLTVTPSRDLGCSDPATAYVGSYAYTVDGKSAGTVVTAPLRRSVSLTARTHSIRGGTRLALHGQVSVHCPGDCFAPSGRHHTSVVVLAGNDSTHSFRPVARVHPRYVAKVPGSWTLTVQPNATTTYIAKVTGQLPHGQIWTTARSRPFTVRIPQAGRRPASARATQRAALKTTTIKVSTHNSRYALSAKTAPRGVVIFKITNPASEPHDFSINGHTSKLLTTGESTTLRVTFHRKGRYSYKDMFDHHAQFGCRGGFRIT